MPTGHLDHHERAARVVDRWGRWRGWGRRGFGGRGRVLRGRRLGRGRGRRAYGHGPGTELQEPPTREVGDLHYANAMSGDDTTRPSSTRARAFAFGIELAAVFSASRVCALTS